MRTIIIADAGGTKTEWLVKRENTPLHTEIISTEGINASVHTDEQITSSISTFIEKSSLKEQLETEIDIYFFGAGCNSDATRERLRDLFSKSPGFTFSGMEFHSDLEGAGRALFGDERGIACIIGTGSASGYYDGRRISDSIPSLGYILGDEGSGAYMGKRLLNMFFKRALSEEIKVLLQEYNNMEMGEIITRIYRQPGANAYLSSFVPFIKKNEKFEQISKLVDESLKLFFDTNVVKYNKTSSRSIGFVGSVASIFSERIKVIAEEYGYNVEKFLQKPILSLGDYYMTHLY